MKVARTLPAFVAWVVRAWLVAAVACVPFATRVASVAPAVAALDRGAPSYETPRGTRAPHVERAGDRSERGSRRPGAVALFVPRAIGARIAPAGFHVTRAPRAVETARGQRHVTPARARGPPIQA